MSCYLQHLDDLLPAEPTPADKRALDERVRAALGMAEADCSEVWAAVKRHRSEPGFEASIRGDAGPTKGISPDKTRHDGVNG